MLYLFCTYYIHIYIYIPTHTHTDTVCINIHLEVDLVYTNIIAVEPLVDALKKSTRSMGSPPRPSSVPRNAEGAFFGRRGEFLQSYRVSRVLTCFYGVNSFFL